MKLATTRDRRLRVILGGALTVALASALALAGGLGRAAVGAASASASEYQYGGEWAVTQIASNSVALGLNEAGVVAGYTGAYPSDPRAALWIDGQILYLKTPVGLTSHAAAVNNAGEAAGDITAPMSPSQAVLWSPDGTSLTLLEGLPEGSFSGAHDLNDVGQVVGIAGATCPAPCSPYHAFVWNEASGIELLPRLDDAFSTAEGINNDGQIVGYSGSSAALWEDGGLIVLPSLEGGTQASAWDINDAGQIVGGSTDQGGVWHAVMWEREEPDGASASAAEYQYGGGWQVVDLGTLGGPWTYAEGINELGQVAGAMRDSDEVVHAFAWADGEFTLLPPLAEGDATFAIAINSAGQIVGTSAQGGEPTAVMWTRVTDTTPPEITVPDDKTVDATSPAGAVVEFTATATDDVDGDVPVSCTPPPGSTFPIGDTTVTCDAMDAAGNSASASFLVTVEGASEQLADLRQAVEGIGPGTSIADKVEAAQAALAEGDDAGACGILNAFIKQVEAQSGKKIDAAIAGDLIADAARIRAVLGC